MEQAMTVRTDDHEVIDRVQTTGTLVELGERRV
jgi:hypothetical protein